MSAPTERIAELIGQANAALTRLNGLGDDASPFRKPAGVLACDVTPERIVWLSPGRLAQGKATILDGDPELGKSTLALEWGARITRGDASPVGSRVSLVAWSS